MHVKAKANLVPCSSTFVMPVYQYVITPVRARRSTGGAVILTCEVRLLTALGRNVRKVEAHKGGREKNLWNLFENTATLTRKGRSQGAGEQSACPSPAADLPAGGCRQMRIMIICVVDAGKWYNCLGQARSLTHGGGANVQEDLGSARWV